MGDLMRRWAAAVGAQPRRATQTNPGAILIAEPKIETLKVTFAPVQSGSGTPSPSNVRPITGHESIAVSIGDSAFTASLGDTYYGGTVDLVSGTMTVTNVSYQFTSENANAFTDIYGADSDKPRIAAYNFSTPIGKGTPGGEKIVAADKVNIYPDGTGSGGDNSSIPYVAMGASSSQSMTLVFPTSYNIKTLAQGRAWVSANPLNIIFTLGTPQTVQLTPQTISALRGMQTVTSGAGSVEISYYTV